MCTTQQVVGVTIHLRAVGTTENCETKVETHVPNLTDLFVD